MKAIPFFTDDIAIVPHTATDLSHLNRAVTIREFADSMSVSLYEEENGELYARRLDGYFMQGPEKTN